MTRLPLIAKRIIRGLLPPFVVDMVRYVLPPPVSLSRPSFVWEGIYEHLRDVPTVNAAAHYDAEQRIEEMAANARHSLSLMQKGQKTYVEWYEALGVLAATVLNEKGYVRVLDFGGGIGHSFIHLLTTVGQ